MVSDLAAAPSNAEESKIETFRRLRGRERWAFFREHFLGWSLLAVGIVALVVAIVVHMLNPAPQMRLEIMVMDMVEDSQSIDAMSEEFAKAAGADPDTIISIRPTRRRARTRTVRTPSCRPSTTWAT